MIAKKLFLFKMVLGSFLFVFCARALFIFTFPELRIDFITYYWLQVASLLAGILVGVFFSKKPLGEASIPDKLIYSKKATQIINYLAILWFLMFLYYLVLNKDLFLSKNVTEIRYEKMAHGSNGASLLGVLLDSLGFCCVIQFLLTWAQPISRTKKAASFGLLAAYILFNALSGGRIGLAFITLYCGLFFVIIGYWKEMSVIKKIVFYGFVLLIFFYCCHIFMVRESLRGRDLQEGVNNLINSFSLTPNPSTSITSQAGFLFLFFWVYLTHAINEFFNLFTAELIPWHGAYSYYKIFYFLSTLGLSDFQLSDMENLSRHGVYFGLLGGAYLDFGNGSFLYLFFIGLISSYFHIQYIQSYNLKYAFILLTFLLLLIFAPVIFVLSAANGLSMLLCSLLYYFMNLHIKIKKYPAVINHAT